MGYRSIGKIYISEEKQKELPDNLKKDLYENWDKDEEHNNVWSFSDWKWYDGYDDVDAWNQFYYDNENDGVELIVIGEDNAVVIEPQHDKLSYSFEIQIYD